MKLRESRLIPQLGAFAGAAGLIERRWVERSNDRRKFRRVNPFWHLFTPLFGQQLSPIEELLYQDLSVHGVMADGKSAKLLGSQKCRQLSSRIATTVFTLVK